MNRARARARTGTAGSRTVSLINRLALGECNAPLHSDYHERAACPRLSCRKTSTARELPDRDRECVSVMGGAGHSVKVYSHFSEAWPRDNSMDRSDIRRH